MACLFVGHTNGTVVCWIRISISRIKQIKYFFGKIQPSICIKIFCMISTDGELKISLPFGDHFMKRFCGGRKIVWVINALLMKIAMYLWHPGIVFFYPALCFYLCLPCPVAV